MPEPALLLIFALATLPILIVPGPDVLYVMARSLGQGRRAGLLSVLGVGAGVLVHTLLAAFGLARLFEHVPAAYHVVRWAGAAYLVYLAIRLLRAPSESVVAGVPRTESPLRLVTQAFLTNLLNPKAALFFLAFVPQFVSKSGGPLFGQFMVLGLLVVALSIAVNAVYAIAAARTASLFRRNQRAERIQRYVSSGILGALAARIAFAGDS